MKGNWIKWIAAAATLLAALGGQPVQAALSWRWEFAQPLQLLQDDAPVPMYATLYNLADSTESLSEWSLGIASFDMGGLSQDFSFAFGPPADSGSFFGQFAGMALAPGESFDFIFGVLTPLGTPAPGQYVSRFQSLSLFDAEGRMLREHNDYFELRVPAVPEVSTRKLLGAGLFALTVVAIARRGRRCSVCA